jgi:hypothetical protein
MTKKSQSQIQKFREAARELDADDNEKRFNEQLGKIAKAKAADAPPKPKNKENEAAARRSGRAN